MTDKDNTQSIGVKTSVRRLLPESVWSRTSNLYWWWHNRGRHRLASVADSRLRQSRDRLRDFHNRHMQERCFILGNGPSLGQMDLAPLEGEVTFGANRIYLLFDRLGFTTTYYLSVNTLVIEQCADEIHQLKLPKFLTWRSRDLIGEDDDVIFLDTDYTGAEDFAEDLYGRVFEGSTVTYVALQLAFFMGFKQAVLIGVDHSFTASGPPNATVVSEGPDEDHFDPGYFGRGFRWQLPDLEASERAYALALRAYEESGREVIDATVGGRLEIFPKVEYESLFAPR